ncbi:hypothetical protein B0H13DRAFT_1885165 [Mycena leptocephala]|nr:hypothetical protein B0H13DRAFT_1885165 [Mycena leptocephala]
MTSRNGRARRMVHMRSLSSGHASTRPTSRGEWILPRCTSTKRAGPTHSTSTTRHALHMDSAQSRRYHSTGTSTRRTRAAQPDDARVVRPIPEKDVQRALNRRLTILFPLKLRESRERKRAKEGKEEREGGSEGKKKPSALGRMREGGEGRQEQITGGRGGRSSPMKHKWGTRSQFAQSFPFKAQQEREGARTDSAPSSSSLHIPAPQSGPWRQLSRSREPAQLHTHLMQKTDGKKKNNAPCPSVFHKAGGGRQGISHRVVWMKKAVGGLVWVHESALRVLSVQTGSIFKKTTHIPNGVVNRTSTRTVDARTDRQHHWCVVIPGLRRFFFLRVAHSFCTLRQGVDDLRVRGRDRYKPAECVAEVPVRRITKENRESSRSRSRRKKNGVHCHLDSSGSGGGRKSRG